MNEATKAQMAAQIFSNLHQAQRKVDELHEQLAQALEEMTLEEVSEYQRITAAAAKQTWETLKALRDRGQD